MFGASVEKEVIEAFAVPQSAKLRVENHTGHNNQIKPRLGLPCGREDSLGATFSSKSVPPTSNGIIAWCGDTPFVGLERIEV